jgi:hypothetical protein
MKTSQKSAAHRHQDYRLRLASKLVATVAVGAFGAMAFGAVHAQATSSKIIGKAPTDGSTVTVHSDTGVTRHGTANDKGRYSLNSLPPGTYEVSLEKDGKTLTSLPGVPLFAGKAFEVDFACDNDQCTATPGR